MVIPHFVESLLQNQFATGVGATAILGAVMYRLKSIPQKLLEGLLLITTVHFTVQDRVEAYKWLDEWLSSLPYAKRTSRVKLISKDDADDNESKWYLTPGAGSHYFFWKNRLVRLSRNDGEMSSDKSATSFKPANIDIRILSRNQSIVHDIVHEAYKFCVKEDEAKIMVWNGDWWRNIYGKRLRGIDSVILQAGQMERIIADIQWFLDNEEYHIQKNISYRRGYLFKGKPGTGKTSIVLCIASHFKKTICVLSLSSITSDRELYRAVLDAPKDSLILIEDVDCAQVSESRAVLKEETEGAPAVGVSAVQVKDRAGMGVSKAGLLNILDGVLTPDGRIFMLTTNHPEKLDEAIIRRGRCDIHEEFVYFGYDEQRRMAERFYAPGEFVPIDSPMSPAKMQVAFTQFPNDASAARRWLIEDTSEYVAPSISLLAVDED